MGDMLIMSAKERKRKVICEGIADGIYTMADAAEKMQLSRRQAQRVWQAYQGMGDAGLVHKSRGKPSTYALPAEFKAKVLALYQAKYLGFGPTFAAEKLAEDDDVNVHPETLRLWLKAAGLWHRKRQRKPYRRQRQRRQRFGELVQIDGSIHDWLSDGNRHNCLLNMVDDASSKTLSQLDTGETCKVLLKTFKAWVERYGLPLAVYVDLKNLYVSPKRLKISSDDMLSEDLWNVFERLCHKLDIAIIKAYSPQAKGRVERNHGVYQDRLVKELALKNIKDLDQANQFLNDYYLNKVNHKFAKPPASDEDAHRDPAPYGDLEQIFCWGYTRQIRNDYTLRFDNEYYQLAKSTACRIRPKQKVIVRKHLDDSISLWKDDVKLEYKVIAKPQPKKDEKLAPGYSSYQRSQNAKKNKHKSPWSAYQAKGNKQSRKTVSDTTVV